MGQSIAVQDDFYIFPVGKVFYVKFRDPLTRELLSKKTTGYKNKTIATQWAREEWQRRCALAGTSDTLLGDYAKFFFTGLEDDPYELKIRAAGRKIGIQTRRAYRSDLEDYILPDPICKKCIALITRSDSIDFRDRLIARFGFTRKTKRIFQPYKNIIHTALEKGLTTLDSVIRLDVAYTKQKRAATTIDNIKILMEPKYWTNQKLRLAALTAGMIGLRAGEIRAIKWKDFDPGNNTVHIVRNYIDTEKEKLPKWGKTRSTIYPKILQHLLEPLRGNPEDRVFEITPQHPVGYKTLRLAFNKAIEEAKIPKITLHGLRHSIQTALRGRGVNPELLRATFGWGGEDVQENYTHRNLYDLSPQMEHTDNLFSELNPMEKE
jgi:integrase